MNLQGKNFAVLLLVCPDRRGIVARVAGWIAARGGNIVENDQYHAHDTGHFFSRIVWDMDNFSAGEKEVRSEVAVMASEFSMDWQLHFTRHRRRMAIMVSRYEHCLYDLLVRERAGELCASTVLVLSNHPDLEPVARHFGIPFHFFPVNKANKAEQERRQIELLQQQQVDLVVLARYMQIISQQMVSLFVNRIINIHHSFLPAFVGAKPYHQAYARGVKIIGATSHYVTEELDQGPIISQNVVGVNHRDTVEELIIKGRNLEKQVLADAVRLHLEFRVLAHQHKTVVFS